MNKYLSKQLEVTTSNVDANNVATNKFLLQTFQDIAVLHANQLGFGWNVLNDERKLWIVSKVAVQVVKPVRLHDIVTVTTWPSEPNKFFADRHYKITNQQGEDMVLAVSRWCIIDFDTRKMANPQVVSQRYYDGAYPQDKSGVDFSGKKVTLDDGFALSHTQKVRWTDLDLNYHVNNAKYVDFALDSLSVDCLRGKYTANFEISYHGECKMDDEIAVYSSIQDYLHKVVGQKEGNTCFTYLANYKNL